MSNIDFQEAYSRVRPSIVGLGSRNDPEFQIIGSGFIIHPSGWIMTNRHVVEALMIKEMDGRIGLRKGAAAFLFITAQPAEGFVGVGGMIVTDLLQAAIEGNIPSSKVDPKRTFRGLKPYQVIPSNPLDVGVCQIDPTSVIPEALPLVVAHIACSDTVTEGTTVGIIGFPQGLRFPVRFDSRASIQLTPLLQVGVISGVLPFSGLPKPDSFVLDIVVNPGSSGSPLFLSNGEVVGVVYATRKHFEPLRRLNKDGKFEQQDDSGVYIPTSLGLAVPSNRFPEQWLHTDNSFDRQ